MKPIRTIKEFLAQTVRACGLRPDHPPVVSVQHSGTSLHARVGLGDAVCWSFGPFDQEAALKLARIQAAQDSHAQGLARIHQEGEEAAAKATAWLAHSAWLNAGSTSLEDIVAHYRSDIRLRRRWFEHSVQFPKHSNMYRWVADTGTPSQHTYRGQKLNHTVIATQPELCYRKALRWKLRAAGITEVRLHWVEAAMDERSQGHPEWEEAARVHGFWRGRSTQDDRQVCQNPVARFDTLKVSHRLQRLQLDEDLRAAVEL